MDDLSNNPEQEQSARESLLRHYSSECIAHGTYVLTVGIAIFAFFEFFPNFIFPNEVWQSLAFGFVLGGLFTLATQIVGRTFLWGYLAYVILWIKPANYKDTAKYLESVIDKATINPLIKLHFACSEFVKKRHKILRGFWGIQFKLILRNFILYSLLFIFLYWIPSFFA